MSADRIWAELTGGVSPGAGAPVPVAFTLPDWQAGPLTAIAAPHLLEDRWQVGGRDAGQARWDLSSSFAGSRIGLIQTGSGGFAEQQSTALLAWHSHIERLRAVV